MCATPIRLDTSQLGERELSPLTIYQLATTILDLTYTRHSMKLPTHC